MAVDSLIKKPTYLISADKVVSSSVVVSVVLHLFLIFGLSFENNVNPANMMQEVTLVMSKENIKKNKSDFIASDNQKGSGALSEKQLLENTDVSPINDDQNNPMQDLENRQKQQTSKQYLQSYLKTTLSIEKIEQSNTNENDDNNKNDAEDEQEKIMAQIATLEAKIARTERILAKQQKVKTVTSAVDTQASPEANYIHNFKRLVEKVGNENYPKQARAKNLHGDVRLMVIVSPKGDVKAIRLLQSSGSKLLDDFAMDSVRQAAPFGQFTEQMKASELRMIRTWRFTDQDTVTTIADSEL